MEEENNKIYLDNKRIERYIEKLEHFNKLMELLKEWTKNINEEIFFTNLDLKEQFGIYHAYQIIVEIMTDIIAMAVKDLKIKPRDDYSNINILKEKFFFSEKIASKLREANGLRNSLVHDYNGVDDKAAYKGIKNYINYLEKFYDLINQWLKKNY